MPLGSPPEGVGEAVGWSGHDCVGVGVVDAVGSGCWGHDCVGLGVMTAVGSGCWGHDCVGLEVGVGVEGQTVSVGSGTWVVSVGWAPPVEVGAVSLGMLPGTDGWGSPTATPCVVLGAGVPGA